MLQVSLKIVDPLLLLWLHEDRVSDQYVFASPISIVHSAVVVGRQQKKLHSYNLGFTTDFLNHDRFYKKI